RAEASEVDVDRQLVGGVHFAAVRGVDAQAAKRAGGDSGGGRARRVHVAVELAVGDSAGGAVELRGEVRIALVVVDELGAEAEREPGQRLHAEPAEHLKALGRVVVAKKIRSAVVVQPRAKRVAQRHVDAG